MLLPLHIIIASLSICFTAYLFFYPSMRKLYLNYFFIVLTLVSGTILLFQQPAHMTQTCIVGLLYILFVTSGIVAIRHKLARAVKE